MKIAVWCLVAVGLAPCVFIAWQYFAYRRFWNNLPPVIWNADPSTIHNMYFRVWGVDIYPRSWAFALLAAGVVFIVVSLVALLHVRLPNS